MYFFYLFIALQSRQNSPDPPASPARLPKTRPSRTPDSGDGMTQSCPTPPTTRRFFSPKTLRAPWGLMSRIGQSNSVHVENNVALSGSLSPFFSLMVGTVLQVCKATECRTFHYGLLFV